MTLSLSLIAIKKIIYEIHEPNCIKKIIMLAKEIGW